jgi:hypothetical protein
VECLIVLHYSPVFIVYWSITCNHPCPHNPPWTRCPRGETIVVIPEPPHEVLSYYFTIILHDTINLFIRSSILKKQKKTFRQLLALIAACLFGWALTAILEVTLFIPFCVDHLPKRHMMWVHFDSFTGFLYIIVIVWHFSPDSLLFVFVLE